eukprot:GDKH01001956.1.p1 GENE.GDKH01001956.1~~GDKH01001956.1.p1  ORF type:complete len:283 (-),score=29.61 GDKH01001956.1:553-1401(-)
MVNTRAQEKARLEKESENPEGDIEGRKNEENEEVKIKMEKLSFSAIPIMGDKDAFRDWFLGFCAVLTLLLQPAPDETAKAAITVAAIAKAGERCERLRAALRAVVPDPLHPPPSDEVLKGLTSHFERDDVAEITTTLHELNKLNAASSGKVDYTSYVRDHQRLTNRLNALKANIDDHSLRTALLAGMPEGDRQLILMTAASTGYNDLLKALERLRMTEGFKESAGRGGVSELAAAAGGWRPPRHEKPHEFPADRSCAYNGWHEMRPLWIRPSGGGPVPCDYD